MKTKILDTTIRDGSYAVNFKFTRSDVRNIVSRLSKLGIEYIEIGHGMGLNASSPERGKSLYSDEVYINVARECKGNSRLGVFCIPNIARIEDIRMAQEHGVDFIRIGVTAENIERAVPYIRCAKEVGLMTMVNFMKSYAVTPQQFADSCFIAHSEGADVTYLVDSAGYMLPEDIETFYEKSIVKCKDLKLGFHGHNNMGMGVANALRCVELGFSLIDCSFQGLGRSIGNVPTEMFVMALQRKYGSQVIDMDIPRLLEYGYVVLKDITTNRTLSNPLELICGYTGFHSSFLKDIFTCCRDYNVDPLRLIIAYTRLNKVDIDYELLCETAKNLPEDNFDDHPYNFRHFFNNY